MERLLSKNSIEFLVNNEILGGVIDFNIKELKEEKNYYEILNTNPCYTSCENKKHIITLKLFTSIFNTDLSEEFIFTVKSENSTVVYSSCKIKQIETFVNSENRLVTSITIISKGVENK